MPVLALLILAALGGWLAWRAWVMRSDRPKVRGPRVTERLTDPREAASVLLVQQAVYEGHVTPAHKAAILALMRNQFEVDEGEAEGLYSFGRMAVGQTGDAANSLKRLLTPIREACTLAEMKAMADMLVQVGETGGPMNDAQERMVEGVRKALSLPAAPEAPPSQRKA